jgi:prolipoprotein diacylglyceryltransferase
VYGLFRFWHEDMRETPKFWQPWSAYQIMALVLAGLGLVFLMKRSFWPPTSWEQVVREGRYDPRPV